LDFLQRLLVGSKDVYNYHSKFPPSEYKPSTFIFLTYYIHHSMWLWCAINDIIGEVLTLLLYSKWI
jgi:hypothetical protein